MIRGLQSGTVETRAGPFKRSEYPKIFFLAIGAFTLVAAAFFWTALAFLWAALKNVMN